MIQMNGAGEVTTTPGGSLDVLLMEDGDALLSEDGDFNVLEDAD